MGAILISKQNVEFIRNLFSAGASMDKQALLAALPELIRRWRTRTLNG